jgi:hypothetical protein
MYTKVRITHVTKFLADEEDCPADGKHVRSQPVSSDIDEKEGWDWRVC